MTRMKGKQKLPVNKENQGISRWLHLEQVVGGFLQNRSIRDEKYWGGEWMDSLEVARRRENSYPTSRAGKKKTQRNSQLLK